jgi:exosortase A-associated hydrolase 2
MIIPRFLEGPRRIFALLHRPSGASGTSVLIVPPFGEEMNKSRKLFTDLAQQLLLHGIATVMPDLYGTGDSEGEFADGDWAQWTEDVAAAARFAAAEGWPVGALIGTRLGCALAARVARESPQPLRATVFWAPVLDGDRYLTQFLRLRVAASMADESRRESVAGLKEQMRQSGTIEVGGYALSARLAEQVTGLKLASELSANLGALHWMEVVRDAEAPLPAPATEVIERARKIPLDVTVRRIPGDPFWQSTEIVRNAALIEQTVASLASGVRGASR